MAEEEELEERETLDAFFDAFCCVVEEVAQILLMGAPDLCLPWSGATFPRGKKSGQNSSEQL
jgi:hypothetical protein